MNRDRRRDRQPPAPSDAFDRAARLLSGRPHFRAELRRKLIQKGHEAVEVEAALDRLARLGYLDDTRLAAEEAARLRGRKGLASAGIAAELTRKGAPRAAIAAAIAGADAADELARALEAGRGWLARGRRDPAALGRFLARKGYPARAIFHVLNELVPEAETPLADE